MNDIIANDKITAKSVRLVSGDEKIIIGLSVALQKAYDQNLDLVQINDAEIPVCKIVDLQKYTYDLKRAAKDAQKKRRESSTKVKEVQITFGIQQNDLMIKQKSVQRFIEEGKHVRVVLSFANRQSGNPEMVEKGKQLITSFVSTIPGYTVQYVQEIDAQGRKIVCTIK